MRDVLTNFFVFFFYSLFHFTVFVPGLFLFLVFFFFSSFFLIFQHVALFSCFLSVFSAPVRSSYSCLFVLVFSFYFFQFQHFSLSLFVDVELWCLKLSFTVTRYVLNPWRTLLAQAPNRTMLYTHLLYPNDSIIVKTDAHRKTHEERKYEGRRRKTSLTIFYLSLYCKGSKGLFKVCMREGAGHRT